MPVQYGGGLRSLPAVRDALRAGAERVILGTAAFHDIDFLDDVLGAFGDRVVVSVDTRGGNVSTSGWQETTQMPADAVIERLQDRGVRSFVYTDVDRDGMLGGLDFDERQADRPRRARALHLLGRHRLARRPARAARPASGQPRRRHRRQGALRGRFTIAEGQKALQPEAAGEGKKPYRPVPAAD